VSPPRCQTGRNFAERGLEGLADAPSSGRPREIDDDEVARALAMTLEDPPVGTTQWSVRRLRQRPGSATTTDLA
jgi:transposase